MDNLDAIAAEATALESAAPPAPGTPPPEPQSDPADDWAQLPALFGSIICMAMPELKQAYTTKNCRTWGEAMVPLAEKYGWDVAEILKRLGPWVGVGLATIPMAAPTWIAIKIRVAAKKAHDEAEKAKAAAPAKPEPQPAS